MTWLSFLHASFQKDEEDLAIDEYREEMMLLFRPFTKAFDLSHLAPVSKEEFCLMPTLSHGLGYGIDLCVVPKTEPVKRGTRGKAIHNRTV